MPGQYGVALRVPDRHGVFKFVVDYRRKGLVPQLFPPFSAIVFILSPCELYTDTRAYMRLLHRLTHLHTSTTVPIVPPRHDGYPRFLSAAWPYYAGAISTSVGFVVFSALWLGGEDKKAKGKAE